MSCPDSAENIIKNTEFLEAAKSEKKYSFKNNEQMKPDFEDLKDLKVFILDLALNFKD